MLLLEQAIEQILLEEGQYLSPLETYEFDKRKQEKIFLNTVKQFNKYADVKKTRAVHADPMGVHLPEVREVINMSIKFYNNYSRDVGQVFDEWWSFDQNTRILTSAFVGEYIMEYLGDYTIGNLQHTYEAENTISGENDIEFVLPAEFKKGSLKIYKQTSQKDMLEDTSGGQTDPENPLPEDTIYLAGSLGTGYIEPATLTVKLKLTDITADNIMVSFVTKWKAIAELDQTNDLFNTWFKVNVLNVIGAIKQQTQLDGIGLPFDTSRDTILDRARALADTLPEMKNNFNKWYNWLG